MDDISKFSGKLKALIFWIVFICEALFILLGIGFDIYTNHIGVKDIFYDSWMTSQFNYKHNSAGTFTAVALAYISLMTMFIVIYFVYREKGTKIKIFTSIFILATLIYTFYIFITGLNYIVDFIFIH